MSEAYTSRPGDRLSFALLIVMLFVGGIAGGLVWSRGSVNAPSPPTGQTSAAADAPNSSTQREALALQAETAKELRALREQVAELREAEHRPAATRAQHTSGARAGHGGEPPSSSAGEATLAYWNRLNEIMAREAAMRAAPPKLTAGNALSFVSGETDAYAYAGGAIRALDQAGVDPAALALAREIAAWYDQGVVNSRQAGSLLQSNDVAARQGQAGKSWKSGAEEHRKQCLEINKRGERLRGELSKKYGLKFPKLL